MVMHASMVLELQMLMLRITLKQGRMAAANEPQALEEHNVAPQQNYVDWQDDRPQHQLCEHQLAQYNLAAAIQRTTGCSQRHVAIEQGHFGQLLFGLSTCKGGSKISWQQYLIKCLKEKLQTARCVSRRVSRHPRRLLAREQGALLPGLSWALWGYLGVHCAPAQATWHPDVTVTGQLFGVCLFVCVCVTTCV